MVPAEDCGSAVDQLCGAGDSFDVITIFVKIVGRKLLLRQTSSGPFLFGDLPITVCVQPLEHKHHIYG